MKKIYVVLLLLLLSGCKGSSNPNDVIVKELNENSSLGLELAMEVTDDVKEQYEVIEAFGGYSMYLSNLEDELNAFGGLSYDEIVYYDITAYPDYRDGGSFVTRILISQEDYHVLGIYVGEVYSQSELETIMYEYDYTYSENRDLEDNGVYSFENHDVNILIQTNVYGEVLSFIVRVDVSNVEGIQY